MIKVKPCPKCWRSWTLDDWRGLPILETFDDGAERRRCRCGYEQLVVDVRHLETLELRSPYELAMVRLEMARHRALRARVAYVMWSIGAAALIAMAVLAWWGAQ